MILFLTKDIQKEEDFFFPDCVSGIVSSTMQVHLEASFNVSSGAGFLLTISLAHNKFYNIFQIC